MAFSKKVNFVTPTSKFGNLCFCKIFESLYRDISTFLKLLLEKIDTSIGKLLFKRAYLLFWIDLIFKSIYWLVSPRRREFTEIEGGIDKNGKSFPLLTMPSEAIIISDKFEE